MQALGHPDAAGVDSHEGRTWARILSHLVGKLGEQPLGVKLPVGTIDVAFYRDDYGRKGLAPGVRPSDIRFPVEDARIILVDDVLYTGRTIRAAMNEIFDYGRPISIRLAALVDRGERQLPICAQYVGAEVAVERDEVIELRRDDSGRLTLALVRKGA